MSDPAVITSTKNPIVKRFQSAAKGEDKTSIVADGVRTVEEALDAGLEVQELVVSPRLDHSDRGRLLRRRLSGKGVRVTRCSDDVLDKISALTTPQGVVARLARPQHSIESLVFDGALLLVAAGVRDPGNLGALVRTAEAAGATGMVAVAPSADPFRDKAVRGSAGSVFRLPVVGGVDPGHLMTVLQRSRTTILVAESDADLDYVDADYRGTTALVVGGEGAGVPHPIRSGEIVPIRIPMRPPVESLNVAVAAAVLLFEARRQRS